MQNHNLQFSCQECHNPVQFSIVGGANAVKCSKCNCQYDFSDEVLQNQLRLFESLCIQIRKSESILSNTSVGVFVGDTEIKVPYKILLTRLNSILDLKMGDQSLSIHFRSEPIVNAITQL